MWVIDGLGGGSLVDMLTDDTDDTKWSIPDIKRIPMRDKVVGEERPASVYELFLDVPLKAALNSVPSGGGDDPRIRLLLRYRKLSCADIWFVAGLRWL